ncbi:hypothetical protein D3C78_1463740 [compost metagenome]
MAQADGPCTVANSEAGWVRSALRMKLMSPWRNRLTFLLRWRAISIKPSDRNSACSLATPSALGAVYSTNSKPSVASGFIS